VGSRTPDYKKEGLTRKKSEVQIELREADLLMQALAFKDKGEGAVSVQDAKDFDLAFGMSI